MGEKSYYWWATAIADLRKKPMKYYAKLEVGIKIASKSWITIKT